MLDFVVDKVTGFLQVLLSAPASIIPPMHDTHFHIHAALIRRTNGRNCGTLKNAVFFGKSRRIS